jgi:hypothetical protein
MWTDVFVFRLSLFLFSLPWLYTISHLIVCEITKQQLSVTALLKAQIPLLIVTFVKFLPSFISRHEVNIMRGCVVLSLIQYCAWMLHVIERFCYHLGMKHWWSVPPFNPPPLSHLHPHTEVRSSSFPLSPLFSTYINTTFKNKTHRTF